MSDEIEKKMLSLFSLGSSYAQISDHIQEMYGVRFSKPAITAVTDKLIPLLQEWKKRPLESIYPFVYLDAIHYKVKEEGHYVGVLKNPCQSDKIISRIDNERKYRF